MQKLKNVMARQQEEMKYEKVRKEEKKSQKLR